MKDILALRDHRKRHVYAALHKQQLRADDHFEQVFDVSLPDIDGMTLKRTKAMREKVMAGVQTFMSRVPRSEVDPRKPTKAGKEQASTLETFYNYILWQHRPLCRDWYQKSLLRGMCVGKLWFDDHYFGVDKRKWTKSQHDELAWSALHRFPIKLYQCDPLNCLPSRAMQTFYRPVDMIEDYEMSIGEAEYLCDMNGWKWKPKDYEEDKVRYTTFYDNDNRLIYLGNQNVFEGENVLGFVPYVVIPSGLGQDSYEGKPEYKYRDIIYQDMEMNELQAMIMSYLHYGFRKNALPQAEFMVDDVDSAKEQLQGYEEKPDTAFIHDRSVEKVQQRQEPINPGIFQFLSLAQGMSSVPQTLLGLPVQNTYSEVHYSTQAAYARAQYEIALDNLEMGIAELLGMCARVVEFLDNPVSIRNVNPGERNRNIETIRPEDIDGYYESRVKFISDTPEGRQTRERQGLEIYRQGFMPHVDVLAEYFDMPQTEAERMLDDLRVEEAMKHPAVAMATALEILDQRGFERAFELLAAEMQNSGYPLPEWAQMKMPDAQMPNKPRGGDHRQPAELQLASDMVPAHAAQTAGGLNPREVRAREGI